MLRKVEATESYCDKYITSNILSRVCPSQENYKEREDTVSSKLFI